MVVYPAGTYYGELFMSGDIVQFHACCDEIVSAAECDPLLLHMQFGMRGGTESYNRKTRVLTVTFNEMWWADNDQNIAWVRNYYDALRPYSDPGGYINFMSGDDQDRAPDNFGANYQRLREIKAKYDPGNLFRMNQNIIPTE